MSFLKTLREKSIIRAVEFHKGNDPERNLEELLFRSTELGGEAGELLDGIKKLARTKRNMAGGKDVKKCINNIEEEIADVIICCDRVAEYFGIDLEKAVVKKFNKTSKSKGFKTRI